MLKMKSLTRRNFLGAAASVPVAAAVIPRPGEIRVDEIEHSYEDFLYRTPYRFGGRQVDRVTLLNVRCRVRSRDGKAAEGFGSMTMGLAWAWPQAAKVYDRGLDLMKQLAQRIAEITQAFPEYGHPIDINIALEPAFLAAAAEIADIPKLCTLVVGSPFDAAIHDAFGKLHRRSCYSTYGSDLMPRDLSAYLGREFRGEYLDRYVLSKSQPRIPLFHSIGAGDPIFRPDIEKPVGDGLPETLGEWIDYNGLTHFKIKLDGADLVRDVDRVVEIERAAAKVPDRRYCLDFNERCPSGAALVEFLRKLKERSHAALERILYLEQPTARDLRADPFNTVHEAAKIKPVVIDESLTDVESLLLAREMGYTGVALKACKGQSQVLLMSAMAQNRKMFLCVQDLTCPGASLIQSVGIAAHTPGAAGIEANAREYVPAANKPWEARFPGIFKIRDGNIRTSELNGPGLGATLPTPGSPP
jgi:L-alanine-DL-glutamate epimerase-like enolase superfamily enzyme